MPLNIEYISIDALIPYARNSRTHSEEQVAQIAASIREFGFTNPVLIDGKKGIVAGHGRLMAARKLGLSEVPVIELAHLTETQKRAYIIADNKLALNAGWDEEILALELDELDDEGFDMDLTGFSLDELSGIGNVELPHDVENQSIGERFLVMIKCKTDAEQRAILERLTNEGYECHALTS